MRPLKTFEEFLKEEVVRKRLPDSARAKSLIEESERRKAFLEEMLAAPVSRTSIVLGKVLAGMTTGVINAFIILGIGLLLGVSIASPLGVLLSIVFILLISMSFVSMGIAFASRMQDMQGFQLIMNFL